MHKVLPPGADRVPIADCDLCGTQSKAAKQEEDTYWQNAGDGAKSKSGNKKDEADKKAQVSLRPRMQADRHAHRHSSLREWSSSQSRDQSWLLFGALAKHCSWAGSLCVSCSW